MKKHFIKVGSLLALSTLLVFGGLNNSEANNAGATYNLSNNAKVYMNAADAANDRNSVSTYNSGTYYVYKEHNGMINITRTPGSPGGWIKPSANVSQEAKPAATKPAATNTSTSDTYALKSTTRGYVNADNARRGVSPRTTLYSGTYYIYKTHNGMLNLTRTKGVPGSWVNPNASTSTSSTTSTSPAASTSSSLRYSLRDLQWHGVINWSGYKFTYYSQRVLPGRGLRIPGRHVNANGYVADKDGYIVLAANRNIAKGSVINTPFGNQGKVYDTCAACTLNWYDVYTK